MLKYLLLCVLISYAITVNAEDKDFIDDEDETDSLDEESSTAKSDSKQKKLEPETFHTPDPPPGAHFADSFRSNKFPGQWVCSQATKDDVHGTTAKYDGNWTVTSPTTVVLLNDYVLTAQSKARYYAISARLRKPFSFQAKKPLIVQYDVNFQNGLDCGGAYIKLLNGKVELKDFKDTSPYTIMFGPDKCGHQSKIHFIIKFKNPKTGIVQEHHAKQTQQSMESYFSDKKSHLYKLVLNPDDSYVIYVDQVKMTAGTLLTTLEPSILPDKEIDDPNDIRPQDWDDREKIPDLDAKKPDDWDEDAPEEIVDTNAQMPSDWLENESDYIPDENAIKPDDWDEEIDGSWEAPLKKNPKCESVSGCGKWSPPKIKNPAFKGKWKHPMITNPSYQGKWSPRKIENPGYFELDSAFEHLEEMTAIGLEFWTMSENIAFDNFLITDDEPLANEYASKTWAIKSAAEGRGSSKLNFIPMLLDLANEKPWIWGVYALVLLIPVVLLFLCFCRSKSSKDPSILHKKTDEIIPDHGEPQADGDEDETDSDQMDPMVSSGSPRGSPIKSASNSSPKKSPTKRSSAEENSDDQSSSSNIDQAKASSGRPRRRPMRKVD